MNWSEYENRVLNYFKSKFNITNIKRHVFLEGYLSKTKREIDILIETQVYDFYIPIVIECKNWTSKLDVSDVGSFIYKLKDIGISKGIMITKIGYSEAAYQSAMNENDIQLFVIDFDKLDEFHGFYALPYSGECGAVISSPSGWIVDAKLTQEQVKKLGQCILYPMGFTVQQSIIKKEIMYYNIHNINKDINNIFEEQNKAVMMKDYQAKIRTWYETLKNRKILFREIYYHNFDYTEFSAGENTDRFYSFLYIASHNDHVKVNLARLKFVISEIYYIVLKGVDKSNSHSAWHKIAPLLYTK